MTTTARASATYLKANDPMQQQRSTAASGAERRSTVSRTTRTLAAWVAVSFAFIGTVAQAENLLLKRSDGTTITNIPLLTSNGCAVVGGGDIEVRPQPAEGTPGDGWCPGTIVVSAPTFAVPSGGAPLSVTPTSLGVGGGTVSATWTSVSAVTQTCSGTATLDGVGTAITGWTGTRNSSQASPGLSFSITASGQYVFFITCTNSAGSTQSSSLTVTVASSGGGGSCPQGMGPSFGYTRQTTMTNTGFLQGNTEHNNGSMPVTQFSVIAGPWPARTQNGTIAIQPMKFVALEFNTGTVNQATYGGTVSNPNRFGTIETSQAAANNGQVLLAYSECPGDFEHLPLNNTRCRFSGGQGLWPWVVGMTDPFACRLEENKTYYLNAAYIDFNSLQSSCTNPEPTTGTNANSCHWFAQPR
jgi:hypothetical protein